MPPLSTSQKDAESPKTSSKKVPAGSRFNGSHFNGSKTASSEWTKLGYEVFNKRRATYAQVPLSISANAGSASYTGSALLDSFVRERRVEPPALQTLRLVNIGESAAPKSEPSDVSARQVLARQNPTESAPDTTIIQVPEEAQIEETQIEETQIEETQIESAEIAAAVQEAAVQIEELPADTVQAEERTASELAATSERVEVKRVEVKEVKELFAETQELDSLTLETPTPVVDAKPVTTGADVSISDVSSKENDAAPVNDSQKLAASVPAQADQDLSDQPPTEAEPDQLDDVPTPQQLPARHPKPQRPLPAPAASAGPNFSASVNQGKRARDSAASVGLIDITDTLLFGGDRPDLASADPFIPRGSETNIPGVLAYLTKQISAFTVDRLQSGFPHNTDPRVLSRLDPPKHKTVLDLENFKLGDLTNLDLEPKKLMSPCSQGSTTDVHTLSQQVEALNRKIAYLSAKLAQVADTAE